MMSKQDNFLALHHSSVLVRDSERSEHFYCQVLGMTKCDRPELPFEGVWLQVGAQQIHLLELPDPCEAHNLPEHGGRDRHIALSVKSLGPVKDSLDEAGIHYTMSRSGRQALFVRDPDGNALELIES